MNYRYYFSSAVAIEIRLLNFIIVMEKSYKGQTFIMKKPMHTYHSARHKTIRLFLY